MIVEDDMMECSVSSLALNIESKDTKISESNWDSHLIEDALLDIINHQPHLPNSSSAAKKDGSCSGMESSQNLKRIVEAAKWENVFLPTYKEELGGVEISDSEGDLVFPAFAVGSPNEDIFKVWDLECSVGEGEHFKQLNKALSASFIRPTPPSYDSLVKEESVHHLTMGVADLSLSQDFGRINHLAMGIADMSMDQNCL